MFNQNEHYQFSFRSGGGPGQLKYPEQICITSDGLVYVTDHGNNCVQLFRQDGKFVWRRV